MMDVRLLLRFSGVLLLAQPLSADGVTGAAGTLSDGNFTREQLPSTYVARSRSVQWRYVPPCPHSGEADDCTSGFPSLDRIDAVLDNYGAKTVFTSNTQVIVPSISFTCSGSILSWTFGGQWQGNTDSFTELQIWRGSEAGVYTIVGSTLINVTQGIPGEVELYHYPLTTPLSFEAGDVLGYFRFGSHLRLVFENVGSDHLLYFAEQDNAASQFTVNQQTDI